MLRKSSKCLIVFVVIALDIFGLFGDGYTAGQVVTLVVNPQETDLYAGSEEIVMTVDSPGKNLTFTWKLSGPGKLEAEGAAAFYTPPGKIDKKSVYATVTVIVKDKAGQETKKSVTLTILPNPLRPPESKPTEKTGLSKTTMVALGVGAAAALGGGIALAGSGGDKSPTSTPTPEPTCGGVEVGGYCWYLGVVGQSCDDVCADRGGCNANGIAYAGSEGSGEACNAVLTALGVPPSGDGRVREYSVDQAGSQYHNLGCSFVLLNQGEAWRAIFYPATCQKRELEDHARACACNQ